MKLHNPTEIMVFLRDDIHHRLLTLKPGEIIDIEPYLRQSLTPYVQEFKLRWLLDDLDLPPGTQSENLDGSYSNFRAHKTQSDTEFNAAKAMGQSDSAEIADIWKQHDTITLIPHEATIKSEDKDSSNFIFPQESISERQAREEREAREAASGISPISGTEGRDDSPVFEEELSDEGPAYLRNTEAPTHLEGFGEELANEIVENDDDNNEEKLPNDAPVTFSQITLSTKAQLWQMADQLGVDATGTKKELIERICKYYWRVHHTNMQVGNNE